MVQLLRGAGVTELRWAPPQTWDGVAEDVSYHVLYSSSRRCGGNLRWNDVGVEGECTSVVAGGLTEWTPHPWMARENPTDPKVLGVVGVLLT